MHGPRSISRLLLASLLILSAAIIPSAFGEPSPIPASVQMLLFSKIWMFDRSIVQSDEIVMAILYQSKFRASEHTKDELLEAVRAGGLKIRCVPVALDDVERVSRTLQNVHADVFYVTEMRAIDILDLVGVSRARNIRTITVVEKYLEAGVAIGLDVRNDKPVILVNLNAARAEGSDLSGQLLKVATIIDEPAIGPATP